MSRKDYVAVDAVMEHKGKNYLVISVNTQEVVPCNYCAFCNKKMNFCEEIKCTSSDRADRNTVIFIRQKNQASVKQDSL